MNGANLQENKWSMCFLVPPHILFSLSLFLCVCGCKNKTCMIMYANVYWFSRMDKPQVNIIPDTGIKIWINIKVL